jgi:hypothetical protein
MGATLYRVLCGGVDEEAEVEAEVEVEVEAEVAHNWALSYLA